MKFLALVFSILFLSSFSFGQDSSLVISTPINISGDGWNKILQMSNSNTLLFHFEPNKLIEVKVFNSAGIEVADNKSDSKLLNLSQINDAVFSGIYEINHKAALFIIAQVDNKKTLIQLDFDENTGKISSENKIVQSPSFAKPLNIYLLKRQETSGYNVLTFLNAPADDSATIELKAYNELQQQIKYLSYKIPTKKYDNIDLIASELDASGAILISIQYSKIIQYPSVYERILSLFYLPKGGDNFTTHLLGMGEAPAVINAKFIEDVTNDNIKLLYTTKKDVVVNNGLQKMTRSRIAESLLILNHNLSYINQIDLDYVKTNEFLKNNSNPNHFFYGIASLAKVDNGLTTVITSGVNRYLELKASNAYEECDGDIGITRLNDQGEVWGTVLPRFHYNIVTEARPLVFGKRTEYEPFDCLYLQGQAGHYIVLNDPDENFSKTIADTLKPCFSYEKTNAVYYHVLQNNTVAKKRLMTTASDGEYRYIYPGSNYFNEQTNQLVVLADFRQNDKSSKHIVWKKLLD